jgi:hypothetical protein
MSLVKRFSALGEEAAGYPNYFRCIPSYHFTKYLLTLLPLLTLYIKLKVK